MVMRIALTTTTLLLSLLPACGDAYRSLLAGTKTPTVRVRLGRVRPTGRIRIDDQGWRAMSLSGRRFSATGSRTFETTVTVGADGIRFQGRDTGSDLLVLEASTAFELDGVSYSGALRIRRQAGQLEFVNELDMETYVAGVIGNEVGPNGADSAYRAQAVTARTYAYKRISANGANEKAFHLFDSAASQVYRGRSPRYGVSYTRMERETRKTRGVILMWNARPLTAYYSSTCGGHTTDCATSRLDPAGGDEALRGVPCRWCKTSKYYSWPDVVRTDDDVVTGFKRIKRPITLPVHGIEISERGRGGWARTVKVTYGPKRKTRELPGPEFRSAMKLRSHNIQTVRRFSGGFKFSGKGWGHGVGMCQWGAREMGKAGANESEILRYYYPGSTLEKLY